MECRHMILPGRRYLDKTSHFHRHHLRRMILRGHERLGKTRHCRPRLHLRHSSKQEG